jgi:hypothetical protein
VATENFTRAAGWDNKAIGRVGLQKVTDVSETSKRWRQRRTPCWKVNAGNEDGVWRRRDRESSPEMRSPPEREKGTSRRRRGVVVVAFSGVQWVSEARTTLVLKRVALER